VTLGGAAGDLLGVPPGPVLTTEQIVLAVAKPRLAWRIVQEHQYQQPVNLGVVRNQFGESVPQSDGLRREFVAAALADGLAGTRPHSSRKACSSVVTSSLATSTPTGGRSEGHAGVIALIGQSS